MTAGDRYLRNRLDYLDYQSAIHQGLPIGPGEIESAHRSIIQQRLKRPGAWWSPMHIEAMLALRLNRANREWETYWQQAEKEAARTGQPVVASLSIAPRGSPWKEISRSCGIMGLASL